MPTGREYRFTVAGAFFIVTLAVLWLSSRDANAQALRSVSAGQALTYGISALALAYVCGHLASVPTVLSLEKFTRPERFLDKDRTKQVESALTKLFPNPEAGGSPPNEEPDTERLFWLWNVYFHGSARPAMIEFATRKMTVFYTHCNSVVAYWLAFVLWEGFLMDYAGVTTPCRVSLYVMLFGVVYSIVAWWIVRRALREYYEIAYLAIITDTPNKPG